MENRISYFLLLSSTFTLISCAGQDAINADLVNSKVERRVDVATHLIKMYTTVTIENAGKTAAGRYFLYAVDPPLQEHLSFIGAVLKGEDGKLTVSQTTVAGHTNKQFWRIPFSSGLEAGKTTTVEIETVFSQALGPYPAQITQAEKQFVVFSSNVFYYSPYRTVSQVTTVNTGSTNIESYTKRKPFAQSDTTISFGPYINTQPFSQEELRVHYENNSPFLSVTSMTRIIEISHWGNIAVEEHVDLLHSGALLKGPFSRYDYQRNQDGVSSIKSFKTILPAAARDVYYRDEIGNISTSHLKELDDSVELELRPRFPLFGGWKTRYYIGYNVPSYEYLYNKGDQYMLKMRLVDHIFDDQVIDQLTVKIILPEGSQNLKLDPPYTVLRGKDEQHFTYLDTVGRPVVVLRKSNLVEQHIQNFQLFYTFQKLLLLQEPLLVVGAFYLLFILVIIYVRLDFSITKDEAKESKMRVASLIEEVQSAQDKRSALYQSYDDAINKYKSNKDSSSFQTSRKKTDSDYKQLSLQIQNLQTQLKSEGVDAAERVAELQKLDSQYKDQISLAINFAEKVINNRLSKQQYMDNENSINKKREDIYAKMESLRAIL